AMVELSQTKTWDKRSSINVLEAAGIFTKHPASLDLASSVPEWSHDVQEMTDALEVLAGEHAKRTLNTAISTAQHRLISGDDPFEVGGDLAGKAELLEEVLAGKEEQTTEMVADEALEIDKKIANGEVMGLPFPWRDFQRRTFGVPNRAVAPLMGRDKTCKSRLATYLSHYWLSMGIPILYFPFEDGKHRLMSNLAATHGEYDMFHIKRDHVNPEFIPRHENSMGRVSKFPLYVHEDFLTADQIYSKIAFHKRKHGIKGVVIDGIKDVILPNADGTTSMENKRDQIINRAAKKFDVSIITISHINKIEEDKWISRRNITGSDNQNKSARFVMILQDSGFPADMIQDYEMWGTDDEIILHCAAASYGEKAIQPLRTILEKGRFDEVPKKEGFHG
ncbi:MAG: DnaB-like helicase C-terminal domain-containing protein, partial [Desulfobulbia bacterium]